MKQPTPPRRARLAVHRAKGITPEVFVRLDASNGETLGTGETHPNAKAGWASRDAWIRAMVEVLEDEGYIIHKSYTPQVEDKESDQ